MDDYHDILIWNIEPRMVANNVFISGWKTEHGFPFILSQLFRSKNNNLASP